jgi:hypothetical protein
MTDLESGENLGGLWSWGWELDVTPLSEGAAFAAGLHLLIQPGRKPSGRKVHFGCGQLPLTSTSCVEPGCQVQK